MRQNIPLRDHRDNAESDREVGESDFTNSGNLVELWQYRVEEGNRNIEKHLRNAP